MFRFYWETLGKANGGEITMQHYIDYTDIQINYAIKSWLTWNEGKGFAVTNHEDFEPQKNDYRDVYR